MAGSPAGDLQGHHSALASLCSGRGGGKADAGLLCGSSWGFFPLWVVHPDLCALACECVRPLGVGGTGGEGGGSQVESPWARIVREGDPPDRGGPGAAPEEAGRGGSGGISNLPRPSLWPGRSVSGCGGGAPGRGRGEGRAGATRASGAAPSPPTPVRARPRSVLAAAPRLAAAARVGRSGPSAPDQPPPPVAPLARGRAHGRSRPAARGLSGPSKRSAAIGAGDSRARHPAPSAGHDPRRDRGAAPQQTSRQVSAPRAPRGGFPGARNLEAGVGWVPGRQVP